MLKQALGAFFKQGTTKVGIITAIMFQLLFSLIWMTGYAGVSDNTKNLKIAIVNEDQGMGSTVASNLKANLPFQTEQIDSNDKAQEMLNNRQVQMVIHISSDFTKKLQTPGQTAPISYTINESNPSMMKPVMQAVAGNVTATVNGEAVAAGATAVLTQMAPELPAEQAGQIAQGLANKVTSDIQSTNKVKDMPNQMLPMMLVLASIVGTMIMGMNFSVSTNILGASVSKMGKLAARFMLTVIAAVVVGLISATMVVALGGHVEKGFMALWLFESLFLLTFAFVAQMFLTLFGNAGMLFNIAMLSLQLVSSGAIVPRELLSSFYHTLSNYFPATYAVNGLMNILFGGPGVTKEVSSLLLIAVIALAIDYVVASIKKVKAAPATRQISQAA
ncbi:ABC transporter permease [Paenibacillus sp. CGMCC 1.16610]|uniref:ABC transporter permease n=1 Tax=Paenibacillus anseongense TaxID=2682845 RepID=A0ABW9U2W2_9BACL|nr:MULTISPECIES: ABC transporter permease [Paenibacillus]MBA2937082.1 ABC transporter permease [Paenibacillus sp. CGMCC 1.16610]MVQ33404.1 ABC transporter permease [Paenibacillus anseongense]